MPRLPSAVDLGSASSLRPQGPIVGGFRSQMGGAMGALGEGMSRLGASINAAFEAEDKFEAERRWVEFQYASDQSFSQAQDGAQPGASGFRDGVVGQYQKDAPAFLKTIPAHLRSQYDMKLLERERSLSRSADNFEDAERRRFAIEGAEEAHKKLALSVQADANKYQEAAESSRVLFDNLNVSPIQRSILERKFGSTLLAKSAIDGILKRGGSEQDVKNFLATLPKDSGPRAGVGNAQNAIASIESGGKYDKLGPVTKDGDRAFGKYQVMGKNIGPWSQAAIGRSVTHEEFLNSPEIQDAVFNHRFGGYVSKYGPEGAARAWFAGEGNMNNPNAKDQLGTSVADYAAKFNRAYGEPAPREDLESFATMKLAEYRDNFERAERARLADEERAARRVEAEAKRVSDAEEVEIAKLLADPSKRDSVTATMIANNPKLTREAVQRNMALVDRADRTDNTYGSKFYELFQRVHAPEGDPNRITGIGQLTPFVAQGGGLTLSGYNELVRQTQGKGTPDAAAESQMLQQFFTHAKQQLSGTNTMLGIKDPKGEEINLKFMSHALPEYYRLRGQGKTSAQLLDPDSPEYIGKGIATLKRPMNEMVRDMISGADQGAGSVDTNNPQAVIAAVQSGRMSRADGERIAREKGWIRGEPTIAPPVSR